MRGHERTPAWSPHGARIAFEFSGSRGRRRGLYVAALSAPDRPRRVAAGGSPSWAPDGRRLVYEVFAGDCCGSRIEIVNADGTNRRTVVRGTQNRSPGSVLKTTEEIGNPAWAGSRRIAYDVNRREIWTTDLRGRQRRRLLAGAPGGSGAPVWLADGRLSFYGPRGLQITRADGRRPVVIGPYGSTGLPTAAASPTRTWARAGSATARRSGSTTCGTRRKRKLVNDASEAAWSPDGRFIAFVRALGRNKEIFVARSDGTRARRVTKNPRGDFAPDWQPLRR